jgi:hypothetical protein
LLETAYIKAIMDMKNMSLCRNYPPNVLRKLLKYNIIKQCKKRYEKKDKRKDMKIKIKGKK